MAAPFCESVVVITGASSGIGRELARQLADQGARLVLAARNAGRLEQVAAECRGRGGRALAVPTDVSVEGQCRDLIALAVSEYGRLDMLINDAGIAQTARLDRLPDLHLFERVVQVNLLGAVYCSYHALPHLKETRGRLVGISSLLGRLPGRGLTSYVASKHALAGFLDALRMELRRTGVSVTVVCPGYVVTEMAERSFGADGQPAGPAGRAIYNQKTMRVEDCARAILQGAARRQREIVLPSAARWLIALNPIAPGLVERFRRLIGM